MTHTITLVTDVFLSKAEALETISKLLGQPVDASDPANAVIGLPGGVVLTIEVPKFGEDLPLTIDLWGRSEGSLRKLGDGLAKRLRTDLNWSAHLLP